MSEIQASLLIAEYKKAFRLANGHEPPHVNYVRGWFTIRYPFAAVGTRHRRKEIEEMRDKLNERRAPRPATGDCGCEEKGERGS